MKSTGKRKPKPEAILDRESGLPICDRCGWHSTYGHETLCDADANRAASQLESAVPESIPRTRFGYGHRQVTFEHSDNLHVRFEISRHPDKQDPSPIKLRDVWLLDDLSVAEAADLVTTIAAWRARTVEQRKAKPR